MHLEPAQKTPNPFLWCFWNNKKWKATVREIQIISPRVSILFSYVVSVCWHELSFFALQSSVYFFPQTLATSGYLVFIYLTFSTNLLNISSVLKEVCYVLLIVSLSKSYLLVVFFFCNHWDSWVWPSFLYILGTSQPAGII